MYILCYYVHTMYEINNDYEYTIKQSPVIAAVLRACYAYLSQLCKDYVHITNILYFVLHYTVHAFLMLFIFE